MPLYFSLFTYGVAGIANLLGRRPRLRQQAICQAISRGIQYTWDVSEMRRLASSHSDVRRLRRLIISHQSL